MTSQQRADILLREYQAMKDPMDSVEVAVEQRLVGLFSATRTLTQLCHDDEGRQIIARPQCRLDLELVRDQLNRILKEAV